MVSWDNCLSFSVPHIQRCAPCLASGVGTCQICPFPATFCSLSSQNQAPTIGISIWIYSPHAKSLLLLLKQTEAWGRPPTCKHTSSYERLMHVRTFLSSANQR